jgi:putative membrane protein
VTADSATLRCGVVRGGAHHAWVRRRAPRDPHVEITEWQDMTANNQVVDSAGSDRRSRPASTVAHGLQGMLMGAADVIPGVSGGTVALILGIYERLIDSIHQVASALGSFLRGDRRTAADHWRRADFGLVIPLGVGIVVALGIGSVVLPGLIEHYPVITSAVFFGLIAGALPIPWRRISDRRGAHVGLAVAGAVVAFLLAGLTPSTVNDPALPVVFGSAAVAICAMILPGVSGAYLLLIMGMYEPTLEAAGNLDLLYLAVFGAGAITGLALFSKLLAWLLDAHEDATMAVLVGLMAGSLRRLWPWQSEEGVLHAPGDGGEVVLAVVCALIGLAAVTALAMVGDRAERSRSTTAADS